MQSHSDSPQFSARTINLPSGNPISRAQTSDAVGESKNGDSRESIYSNEAPTSSQSLASRESSNDILTPPGETSETRAIQPPRAIGIVSPCGVSQGITSEYSRSVDSSLHFFRIRDASSHETMFILLAHIHGAEVAKQLAAKFRWQFQQPMAKLLEVTTELDGNCNVKRKSVSR
jgi:hypothetical protein